VDNHNIPAHTSNRPTRDVPARPTTFIGGAGLASTALDYLRLLRMFQARGTFDAHTILRSQSVGGRDYSRVGEWRRRRVAAR
jgi:CubicO group peptidase (beta-lactamase class C family)